MLDLNNISDDEKHLILHLTDISELCRKYCKPQFSAFLNERQTELARLIMQKNGVSSYYFWGGYDGASRLMLCIYPEYCRPDKEDFPFVCINLSFRSVDKITHRDLLGALMALGIKRDTVGDIVVQSGIASFFVKSDLEQYIKSQIRKIGRVGVSFCDYTADFNAVQQEFTEKSGVVSSLRVDSVISAAVGLSRSKVQQAVAAGKVAKNFEITYSADCKVCSGDKISVRGYGKFTIQFDGSVSKKGKYRVIFKQFR